jgi:multidrug resistance protein, MATE family
VKIPSFIAFFSYWIAGIPVSYVLGIKLDWGVNGVWVGFIVGLSFASILIIQRFFRLLKRLNTPNL